VSAGTAGRIRRIFAAARGAGPPAPSLAGQVEAILSSSGFTRFRATDGTPVVVALDRGHYREDRHRALTLAQMANRVTDYGLLAEVRNGCLCIRRRGAGDRPGPEENTTPEGEARQ
jgi:hypothetical protein